MNLTAQKRAKLSTHLWSIHTLDTITQTALTEHLAKSEGSELTTKPIFYNGKKLDVIMVSLEDVEYMVNKRDEVPVIPYNFTAYHKESVNTGWVQYKEEKNTPLQRLRTFKMFFPAKAVPKKSALRY